MLLSPSPNVIYSQQLYPYHWQDSVPWVSPRVLGVCLEGFNGPFQSWTWLKDKRGPLNSWVRIAWESSHRNSQQILYFCLKFPKPAQFPPLVKSTVNHLKLPHGLWASEMEVWALAAGPAWLGSSPHPVSDVCVCTEARDLSHLRPTHFPHHINGGNNLALVYSCKYNMNRMGPSTQ